MKNILTTLLLGVALNLCADSWQHMHTFPNNQYTHIIFNGEEYLCMQGFSKITKSSDLLAWQNPSNVSAPDALYETGAYGVSIRLLEASSLANGTFVSIVEKHEYPAMGNTGSFDALSLLSTNGSDWDEMASIIDYFSGSPAGLNTFDAMLVYVDVGDYIGFVPVGSPTTCDFYTYNPTLNQWTNTFETDAWPMDSFCLYQDQQTSFFSFPSYTNLGAYQTLCSKDGRVWRTLGDRSSDTSPADAHDGLIISRSQIYSAGKGWEIAPYSDMEDIIFNGNRLAGRQGEYLIYSDDFGQTLHQTYVSNLIGAKIIEANDQYVALLNMKTNVSPTQAYYYTSIYALDASPTRTSVSTIGALDANTQSIAFPSTSNVLYQVESCTNLIDATWQNYGLPILGTGTNLTVNLPENLDTPIFFKVRAINN